MISDELDKNDDAGNQLVPVLAIFTRLLQEVGGDKVLFIVLLKFVNVFGKLNTYAVVQTTKQILSL